MSVKSGHAWQWPANVPNKFVGWDITGRQLANKDGEDILNDIGAGWVFGLNPGTAGLAILEDETVEDVRAYLGIGTFVTPEFSGAAGDAFYSLEGSITATDTTFTCAPANFTAADIGKPIAIRKAGANATDGRPGTLVTTIAAINSTTSVELTAAATNTVASKSVTTTAVNGANNVCTAVAHGLVSEEIVRVTEAHNGFAKDGLYYVYFDADTAAAAGGDADNFKLRAHLSTTFALTGTTNFTVKVDVEWGYGTDDTAAWQAAIATGKKILGKPGATYFVTAPLGTVTRSIDLNGCFVLGCYPTTLQIDGSESLLLVDGADNVTVSNGRLGFLGDFITDYASGVACMAGRNFKAIGIEGHGWPMSAVRLGSTSDPAGVYAVIDPVVFACYGHHNRHAGLYFGNTQNLQIIGGHYHFNGLKGDATSGYGTASSQSSYPLNTSEIGVHANDNYRKGIDYHAGVGITIIGCFSLRNVVMGIYAEDTRITGSVIIKGNTVGEMTYYGATTSTEGSVNVMYGIMVGAQSGQGLTADPTRIQTEGNTIYDFTDATEAGTAVHPIFFYGSGLSYGEISAKNNAVHAGHVTSLIGSANTLGSNNGNYYDCYIDGNVLEAETTSSIPVWVRSNRNRKKSFRGNTVKVGTAGNTTAVYFHDTTTVATELSFICTGNDIDAPTSAWSTQSDWNGLRRVASEIMSDNTVNGEPWRDWDGKIFRETRTALPSAAIQWTVGSLVEMAAAAAPGSPEHYKRVTNGTAHGVPADWLPSYPQYILQGTATFDCPSLADGAGTSTNITVTGAALGDFCVVSPSASYGDLTVTALVNAADNVLVRIQNESGGVLDPASVTLRARVFKL